MPKRLFDDFDPNKSDPEDEDYDASAHRRGRATSRPTKAAKSKPQRKRQRTGYGEDGSEDISDSMLEDYSTGDESSAPESSEEEEINQSTGRPIRRSAKKQVKYEDDSDEGSVDFMNRLDDNTASRSPQKNRKQVQESPNPTLLVKLKLPRGRIDPRGKRDGHVRTNSTTSRKGSSSFPLSAMTRRSSRLAQDETAGLIALTTSGNHTEIIKQGTKSPEAASPRQYRANKGMKKLPSAIIEGEDDEPRSTQDFVQKQVNLVIPQESHISDDDDLPLTQNLREEVEVTATQVNTVETDAPVDLAMVPESDPEDEEMVVQRRPRGARRASLVEDKDHEETEAESNGGNVAHARRTLRARSSLKKKGIDDTSDFEPEQARASDEDISSASGSDESPQKAATGHDDSSSGAQRPQRRARTTGREFSASNANDSEVAEELQEELQELRSSRPKRRQRRDSIDDRPRTRTRKPVDYRILRPETNLFLEEDGPQITTTPSRRRGGGGGGWQRSLFSTYGPFGGAGGPAPVFGAPGAAGGVESDSSDDEILGKARPGFPGGMTAATPTAGAPPGFGMFPAAQTHSIDPLQTTLGKIKDKHALADADPLGVDQNVKFDGVGGLQGHIDQLKEMVMLPLLYPEIFQRFKITPPRGVLFHGPPGTGKTLMARALASTVSSEGQKVSFYMRKGADALSKWVGEAERQLRLLFEEARKNQPSIIFFDEIDGLAPVRSSKQEQIHASIVSTLLALMDGMDGRGQVVVIGATNRPDSVDPALRRPGRFDREFYFPLPDQNARRAILDIHTKGWEPPLPDTLKDQLASATKGYGGADLRALCTEAALNSVQRTYPQIYRSSQKRVIKPESIHVIAKDFMISLKKIVPSSERSASSGASPLPKNIEPLLQEAFGIVTHLLDNMLPRVKRRTALEEAEFEEDKTQYDNLDSELLHQEFERVRVFRPRLLVRGDFGMGQQYLASAILQHFEGIHVQNFDLATILGDSTRSPEASIIQLFTEVKRHKPSVLFLPNVDNWCQTVGPSAVSTFLGLLRSLTPTDPVLVLGVVEGREWREDGLGNPDMVRQIFGYSSTNQFQMRKPNRDSRRAFFAPLAKFLDSHPTDFPDPESRKKRVLEELPLAPKQMEAKAGELPKDQVKAQRKRDRQTLNYLKVRIQPIMDQIRNKYKKFRLPIIEENQIRYLFEEQEPTTLVTTDMPEDQRRTSHARPYERSEDAKGEPGLLETATGKFYYNMETVTIERRLANGYYGRPKDFLRDIKKLTKDARTAEDQERLLKASELQTNVEVDLDTISNELPSLIAECEALYQRKINSGKTENRAKLEGNQMPPPEAPSQSVRDEDAEMQGLQAVIPEPVEQSSHDESRAETSFYPASQQSVLTNGTNDLDHLPGQFTRHSTSDPSNGYKTSESSNYSSVQPTLDQVSFEQSAQTRSLYHSTGAPFTTEQRFQAGHLSQRGAITPLAEGSNPAMYHNSASTTSSDKRNTNSSGDKATQSTPAQPDSQDDINYRLDVSVFEGQPSSGSQLPNTQSSRQDSSGSPTAGSATQSSVALGTQSQSQPSQPSQAPAVPKFPGEDPLYIARIVNGDLSGDNVGNNIQARDQHADRFTTSLIYETSSCSLEQLEQVNSVLMDYIWKTRSIWDRASVVNEAGNLLRETLADMRELQEFGKSSMENGFTHDRQ